MKIERVFINGRRFYFVDGERIRSAALIVIGQTLFTPEMWNEMWERLTQDGWIDIQFGYTKTMRNADRDHADKLAAQLKAANKKIATLEQKVARCISQLEGDADD